MNALVFDRQTDARNVWQTVFSEFDIQVAFADSFSGAPEKSKGETRILVFDQSVVGTDIESMANLCSGSNLDVVVVSGNDITVASAVRLMKHGASWVFRKELEIEHLREALPMIRASVATLETQIAELCRLQALMRNISPREHSVLELVLDGVPNKQIARQLEVSVRTVESRRAKIYRKCEVSTVTELVRCVDRAHQLQGRYGNCPREIVDSGK